MTAQSHLSRYLVDDDEAVNRMGIVIQGALNEVGIGATAKDGVVAYPAMSANTLLKAINLGRMSEGVVPFPDFETFEAFSEWSSGCHPA